MAEVKELNHDTSIEIIKSTKKNPKRVGLQSKVDGLQKDVNNFEAKMDGLQNNVTGLQENVTGLKTKMDKIFALLTKLSKKKTITLTYHKPSCLEHT